MKKKRPNQTGQPVMVRLQPNQLSALDAWIGHQHPKPSRPEAIRRLVAHATGVRDGTLDAFHSHEVLHTVMIIAEMFENYVAQHRFTQSEKTLRAAADELSEQLADFYQKAGEIILGS